MSFYIYQLVEPVILSNTSINLSAISYKLLANRYQLSAISYQLAYQLSAIFIKQSLNYNFLIVLKLFIIQNF